MPLLSQETAKKQYDRLYNSHHTDTGGLASKVVTFQHNMQMEILYEITGLRNFYNKYDPNDIHKKNPWEKRIIEQGQLGWLYDKKERIRLGTGEVIRGFVPDVLIDDIKNLKKWRNTGEHKDIMPWDKYLAHLGTMARTISLFSGMPIPKNINDILNNQASANSSNSTNREKPKNKKELNDAPKAKKPTVKTTSMKEPATRKTTAKTPAAKKPVIKRTSKTISRKKTSSKLAVSSRKPKKKKPVAKTAVVKKTNARKLAAKKPAAKKSVAKKTTTKKLAAKKPVVRTSKKVNPKGKAISKLAASSAKPQAKKPTTKKPAAKKPAVERATTKQKKQKNEETGFLKKLRDFFLGT
jgi:hypothetical protein